MSNSDYLVCYLSEKEEEELTYHDNPNVLIELGYFIGKHTYLSNLKNILIIREERSEKNIPFDIKDIVTLSVARFDENNKVNKDILINDLKVKIDSFLTYIVHQ